MPSVLPPVQLELSGPVDYRHVFLNMSNITVAPSPWTRAGHTCPPAMGMSFAAGTTDGLCSLTVALGLTSVDGKKPNGTTFIRVYRTGIFDPCGRA